jgi:fibrillarin-like rRNA methylase
LIAVNAKKLATFAGIALALFFVIAQPGQAAVLVQNIITFLRTAAESVISFVSSVFKG